MTFSGSYLQEDVQFLLKRLTVEPIADIDEKEALIQSGVRHYSEIIGVEKQPTDEYLRLFDNAVRANAARFADDLIRLAAALVERRGERITLVSLARAGTPVGVLLRRILRAYFGVDAPHYSISIIRDRGVDRVALDHICGRHPPESIAFIDGWTGKGAIASELTRSIAQYQSTGRHVSDELFVVSDLAGLATASGSYDDYLIPSSILNSTISGLVSRSILNGAVGPDDFHGCLFYDHLAPRDISRWFVERIMGEVDHAFRSRRWARSSPVNRLDVQVASSNLVRKVMTRFSVDEMNYVKPGIGEATRSLLRRAPRILLLREERSPEIEHLHLLAEDRNIPIEICPWMPVRAVAIIRKLGNA